MPGLIFPGTYFGVYCEGMGDYLYAESQNYEAMCKQCDTHISKEAEKYEMQKGGVLCTKCWSKLCETIGYIKACDE